jgi:hypothetical protein
MKKLFCIGILILVSSISHAQTSEFGKITPEEIQMKKYPLDTSASAVILFDKGEYSLNEELAVEFKRHTRVKFLTKEGIDDWATRTIKLTHNQEGISKLKASSYNLENGSVVESKMDEKSIFKTKYDRYTDELKFTIPNVKEGSVIEYSYILRSSDAYAPNWQFQHLIPTIYSEYKTYIPSAFTFRHELKGFIPITERTTKGSSENWIMKNVPAFKEEPFTLNVDEYISRIQFTITELFIPGNPIIQLGKTWPKIVQELLEDKDFGVQVKTSGFLKEAVAEVTAGITEDEQKTKLILEYVKSKIDWNRTADFIPDHPFKKVLEEKKGSSSEINLLLVSMLQKAGINAHPVLLSTRKHGMINPFWPRYSDFNDVICIAKIGTKKFLLDGTDRGLPMNALPERCLNGEGLVISKDEMEWIPLTSTRSRKVVNADYKLNSDGEVSGKLTISRDGLDASDMRESYKDLGKEKYLKDFIAGKSWVVSNSSFENLENPNQSAKEIHDITINDHSQVAGNIIYVNPYITGRMEENIFKSENRLYPVDYGTPVDQIYMAKIQIPDGYSVEELPKQRMILLPSNGGKFVYTATLLGNTLNFVSQFIINKSIFTAEEYPHLREFYMQVVAKQAEQIVLKKK